MLRSIEPEVDLNILTQWLNDVECLRGFTHKPPTPASKGNAKKMLENFTSKQEQNPVFIICERPVDGESPTASQPGDDYYIKDGKARYPAVGLLSIGSPDGMHVATRIGRLGIALDQAHQG